MIEAFEIGVSLVLRDGISDSIALTQRNLVALEKALSSSGMAIQSLRDAGSKAASASVTPPREHLPSSIVPQRTKSVPLTKSDSVTTESLVPKSLQTQDGRGLDIGSMTSSATLGESEKSYRPPSSAPRWVLQQPIHLNKADNGSAKAPIGELSARSGPLPKAALNSPLSATTGSTPESKTVAAPSAPVGWGQRSFPENPSHVASQRNSDAGSIPEARSFGARMIDLSEIFALFEKYSPANECFFGIASANPNNLNDDVYERAHESSASSALSRSASGIACGDDAITNIGFQRGGRNEAVQGGWPEKLETPSQTNVKPRIADDRKPAAPQASQRESQALSGDVYLDGVLLGRWVSRFLQKQAERADAGPTGFDPKRGRLLPGVTVGG